MKKTILLLTSILIITSCITTKEIPVPTYNTFSIDADFNNLYVDGAGNEYKVDSLLLDEYPRHFAKMDSLRRSRILYAKTDMQTVKIHPSKKDFQAFDYKKGFAHMEEDTLMIDFNFLYKNDDVVYFAADILRIKIWDKYFSSKIVHSSDVSVSKKVGDKYVRVPFPSTPLPHAELTLNQSHYMSGDTIKGTFFGKSIVSDADWEIFSKGNFRLIIKE